MKRPGSLLAAAILIGSCLAADAAVLRCVTDLTDAILIPGITNSLSVRVVDESNRTATNWYGTLLLSADKPGLTVDPASLIIVRGVCLGRAAIKATGPAGIYRLAIGDAAQSVTSCTESISASDPEDAWLPERPALEVNEIMFDTDLNLDEWIEFYNPGASAVSFLNYAIVLSESLSPAASYRFWLDSSIRTVPDSVYSIAPGGFLLLVRDLSRFMLHYPAVYEAIGAQTGIYAGSVIAENPSASANFDLGSALETVYIRSNDVSSAPILSLVCYSAEWGGSGGNSLSRRDPFATPLDPANWRSSEVIGGTPGRPNDSATGFPPPGRGRIVLATNAFDPSRTSLCLTVEADRDLQNAEVDVVSTVGRSVRHLESASVLDAGDPVRILFDGLDDNGNRLSVGLYFVRFTGFTDPGERFTVIRPFAIAGGVR